MPSSFSWVDFAESDRRRMLDMLALFADHETRDEMGLGTIRDAFANHFFPGTSTIQTRARYMLFIPWLFKNLERHALTPAEYRDQARRWEISLIHALLKGGETRGVIGQDARGSLQRPPSHIYWVGLGSWGIRLFRGTQYQYFRYLPTFYVSKKNRCHDDDREPIDHLRENWHMGIPESPKGLTTQVDFSLTREEADYLSEMVVYHHQETLLAQLMVPNLVLRSKHFWDEPMIASLDTDLSHHIQHARNFSESMQGAALLYNLMLARKRQREDWAEDHNRMLLDWVGMIQSRWMELSHWHTRLREFWESKPLMAASIPIMTRRFVEAWLGTVFSSKDMIAALVSSDTQSLIQQRESQLKGKRSRLLNKRALEIWNGASGIRQLDYRWANAVTIVNDISEGLSGNSTDA